MKSEGIKCIRLLRQMRKTIFTNVVNPTGMGIGVTDLGYGEPAVQTSKSWSPFETSRRNVHEYTLLSSQ